MHVFRVGHPLSCVVLYCVPYSTLLLTDSTLSYGPAMIVEREQIEQVDLLDFITEVSCGLWE